MNRSSARSLSRTSSGLSTPIAAKACRAASSMASSMNDQFSAVETPGIASETLPGDQSTSGSVATQCSGFAIPVLLAALFMLLPPIRGFR